MCAFSAILSAHAVEMPDAVPTRTEITLNAERYKHLKQIGTGRSIKSSLYLMADGFAAPMWEVEKGMLDLYVAMKQREQRALAELRSLYATDTRRWQEIEKHLRAQLRSKSKGKEHRAAY